MNAAATRTYDGTVARLRSGVFAWAAVVGIVLLILGTNPGYGNADELLLLRQHDTLPEIAQGFWADLWRTDQTFYRPLGYASFRLQMLLGAVGAPLVHLASILHHLGNAWLLVLLLRALALPTRAAIWYLAVPTAIAGVAWVAAVYDRLLVTWLLGAALFLARRGAVAGVSAIAIFAVALLTKETAIAFVPAALLLQFRIQRQRAATVAICALAAAFLLWRMQHFPDSGPYRVHVDASAAVRLLRYLAFPFAVTSADPATLWSWQWLPGLLGIVTLTAIACVRTGLRATLGYALLTLAPLGPVLFQPQLSGHYLYTASLGFVLLLDHVLTRSPKVAAVLIAWLAVHAVVEATHWHQTGRDLNALVQAHETLGNEGCVQFRLAEADGTEGRLLRIFRVYVEEAHIQPTIAPDSAATPIPRLGFGRDGRITVER